MSDDTLTVGEWFSNASNPKSSPILATAMTLRDYFAIHGPEPGQESVAHEMSLDAARNPR